MNRTVAAVLLALGAAGSMGCQLIASPDRSNISGGAGGQGGTGGQGGAGGSEAGCGDGAITEGEACDDGNTEAGDGCDAGCAVETGYACSGAPSTCGTSCGDGIVAGQEACDDTNNTAGDGCDPSCAIESGYDCTGSPSACATTCGDGTVAGTEACDDGNTDDCDGCRADCSAAETGCGDSFTCGAEACDDGNATDGDGCDSNCTATACGNGVTSAGEACDDGNATSDDGCDANCTPTGCGNGIVTAGEACDDGNTADCDGCRADCGAVETGCGDTFVCGAEQCDDGNQVSLDGCNNACVVDAFTESEANNTAAQANGPYTPEVLISGAVTPLADVDFFAITLPATADLYVASHDATGPTSCAPGINTVVTLYGTDGTTTLVSRSTGNGTPCGAIDSTKPGDAAARHLPAGTYYVSVGDYLNNNTIAGYTLVVQYNALCGDGVVEGAEECDGGAGCTATCDRVQVCGDGFVDAPETCDDGNTTPGDGCDAACALETTAEVEPNNATADADAAPVQLTGSAVVTGAIDVVGDLDVFRLTLAQDSVVRFETFETNVSGCGAIATTLRIHDAGGAQLYADDAGGVASCSALVVNLPAGTYYAQVEERDNNATIAAYNLQVSVVPSGGSEAEVNDSQVAANPVSGAEVYVVGGHLANDDSDYFAINVPFGKSLRAELIEGGAETCESNGVDSYLTLFDASGVELGFDDDAGRGFCSMIDGTGAPAENGFAGGLSGTYYLQVTAAPFASSPGDPNGQFDYRLVITIR